MECSSLQKRMSKLTPKTFYEIDSSLQDHVFIYKCKIFLVLNPELKAIKIYGRNLRLFIKGWTVIPLQA
jgi:hypothetical protein